MRKFNIHLGLHKTGTTSFQKMMRQSIDELQAKGRDYLDYTRIRPTGISKRGKYGWRHYAARLRGLRLPVALARLSSGFDRDVAI